MPSKALTGIIDRMRVDRVGTSSSLIGGVVDRLAAHWARPVQINSVKVDLVERAVFTVSAPNGMSVFVKTDRAVARCRREVAVLGGVHAAGLPTPQIIHVDFRAPTVLVLQQLAGRNLDKSDSPPAWNAVGRAVGKLHQLSPPQGLGPFAHTGGNLRDFLCHWVGVETTRCRNAGLLSKYRAAELVRDLTRRFTECGEPVPQRLLHGDCQPVHFLLDDTRTTVTGVIDFGDTCIGEPVWDIAVLTAHNPEHLPAVLAGYRPDSATKGRICDMITSYWALRQLGEATWLHTNGFDPTPALTRLNGNV